MSFPCFICNRVFLRSQDRTAHIKQKNDMVHREYVRDRAKTLEHFVIHHQSPIEAIKGLWGDPAFSRDLVYKPAKLFRGSVLTEEERMFSEMWTAGFWNAAQVHVTFLTPVFKENLMSHIEINSPRRDSCSSHYCFRQDSVDTIFWKQVCISILSHSW